MFKNNSFVAVIVAVVAFFCSLSTTVANAATVGWNPSGVFAGTEITSTASIVGDHNGVLTLTCDETSKSLRMTYVSKGNKFDFFTVRSYGKKFGDDFGSLIVGPGSTKGAEAYGFLIRAEYSFEVTPYALDSKEKWEQALKDGDKEMPVLEAGGPSETFITGPVISSILQGMLTKCPMSIEPKML